MHITILAVGSRGDVQPYLALALGLKSLGHHVQFATHSNFKDFVKMHGLHFAEVKGNPREWLETDEGLTWIESGPSLINFYQGLKRFMEPVLESLLPTSYAACRDSDVILYSSLAMSGPHIAEKIRRPGFPLMLQPVYPTGDFPSVIANVRKKTGRFFNYLTHLITDQVVHQSCRCVIDRWRRQTLGLSRAPFWGHLRDLRQKRVPHFMGYSRHVVPRPNSWKDHVHVTGYWFLDRPPDWQPAPELLDFLRAGPPPVYVGFGSITVRKSEAMTRTITEALNMAGVRGILLSGWGKLGSARLPKSILQIDSVPHDWLFPQLAAVVHHGGAGTTAAGLRAGVPSILTPFFADQFFWAERVTRLGVGPPYIPNSELTAEKLAAAIRLATSNPQIACRAKEMSQKIRAEGGVAYAAELLDKAITTRCE